MNDSPRTPVPGAADRVAVLIPCFNEARTIRKVVEDFRLVLPGAGVYVYDNNSTDGSADLAREAGAIVRLEKRQGKGFVVAAMLREVDADVYVLVDGDDTYPADAAAALIEPIRLDRADMAVGNRMSDFDRDSFRSFHVAGNRLVVRAVNLAFGSRLRDVMSGYRAFGRRFVDEIPVVSRGFEIETEITLQALYRGLVVVEVPVRYGARPEGSRSKLRTFRDGARVVVTVVDIFKAYRPLLFFGLIALVLGGLGVALGAIPVVEFIRTGRVDRFPTAILATGLVVTSMLSAACGAILDGVNHRLREVSELVVKSRRKSGV